MLFCLATSRGSSFGAVLAPFCFAAVCPAQIPHSSILRCVANGHVLAAPLARQRTFEGG